MTGPLLLSVDEVASKWLGVKKKTLETWIHRGLIPHVRLGPRLVRFDADELRKWIDSRRVGVK